MNIVAQDDEVVRAVVSYHNAVDTVKGELVARTNRGVVGLDEDAVGAVVVYLAVTNCQSAASVVYSITRTVSYL